MVIAHAAVLADAGRDVTILIQEHDGTALAWQESARLARTRPRHGTIRVWDSQAVLLRAAGAAKINSPLIGGQQLEGIGTAEWLDDSEVPFVQSKDLQRIVASSENDVQAVRHSQSMIGVPRIEGDCLFEVRLVGGCEQIRIGGNVGEEAISGRDAESRREQVVDLCYHHV